MSARTYLKNVINEFLVQPSIRKLSKKAKDNYQFILISFADYLEGSSPYVDKITTEDIALYFNYLQGCQFKFDPYRQYKKPPTLERARVEQAKKELYTFWKWAAGKYEFSNPFIPKTVAEDSKRILPISEDEMRRLLNAVKENYQSGSKRKITEKKVMRDTALVLLLIETGILAEELGRVTVRDIDFEKRNITIHDVSNNKRNFPLSKELNSMLYRYSYRFISHEINSAALVFTTDDAGTPLDRKTIHLLLVVLGKKAGIENLYALRLRAWFTKFNSDDWLFEENAVRALSLSNKHQLRLYLDEDEIQYEAKSSSKKYSLMDEWDLMVK